MTFDRMARARGGADAGPELNNSTLAAEVLRLSGLLAQEQGAKEGGQYSFPADDDEGQGGSFVLSRDDTLQIIGLLNSRDDEIAKRELGVLLGHLERPAVEGLVRRLYATLRRRSHEFSGLLEANALRRVGHDSMLPCGASRESRPMSGRVPASAYAAASARAPAGFPPSRRVASGEGGFHPAERAQERQPPGIAQTASPRGGGSGDGPTRSLRSTDRGEMPQVFRRLTAPAGGAEEAGRASVMLDGTGTGPGVGVDGGGPQVTAYLAALLEAHEQETGHPAASSRYLPEDFDSLPSPRGAMEEYEQLGVRRCPRVPEAKAAEIFERLHRTGKEHRVRRRVYLELGLMVEQAREAQTCTFEPRVPLAQYYGGITPLAGVSDRLYNDSLARKQRLAQLAQNFPAPSFQPQTLASAGRGQDSFRASRMRGQGVLSPRDTLPAELDQGPDDDLYAADQALSPRGGRDDMGDGPIQEFSSEMNEPAHLRLFREHADRKVRQHRREEMDAEWRKHSYRPDIQRSQATGPQILRQYSAIGLMPASYETGSLGTGEEEIHGMEETPVEVPIVTALPFSQWPQDTNGIGHSRGYETTSLAAAAVAATSSANAAASGAAIGGAPLPYAVGAIDEGFSAELSVELGLSRSALDESELQLRSSAGASATPARPELVSRFADELGAASAASAPAPAVLAAPAAAGSQAPGHASARGASVTFDTLAVSGLGSTGGAGGSSATASAGASCAVAAGGCPVMRTQPANLNLGPQGGSVVASGHPSSAVHAAVATLQVVRRQASSPSPTPMPLGPQGTPPQLYRPFSGTLPVMPPGAPLSARGMVQPGAVRAAPPVSPRLHVVPPPTTSVGMQGGQTMTRAVSGSVLPAAQYSAVSAPGYPAPRQQQPYPHPLVAAQMGGWRPGGITASTPVLPQMMQLHMGAMTASPRPPIQMGYHQGVAPGTSFR